MTYDQIEIIRGMSGPELQDLFDRGMSLPRDAAARLAAWRSAQADRMRERVRQSVERTIERKRESPLLSSLYSPLSSERMS